MGIFYLSYVNKKISLQFGPDMRMRDGKSTYAVTKSIDGKTRRYIEGIASGTGLDGHGERMTSHAVQSFMSQANSKDILLYPDIHGIRASEDIGILDNAVLMPGGDWHVSFRLYDESDGIEARKLETINTLWKQINGLPPYNKPRQMGFSVEGNIPEGCIKEVDSNGRRVIDDIDLDGVVLVPKPAYKPSVATAVMKALDAQDNRSSFSISSKLEVQKSSTSNYLRRVAIQDAFEDLLPDVMKSKDQAVINKFFDEYKTEVMKTLVPDTVLSTTTSHNTTRKSLIDSLQSEYSRLSGLWNQRKVRKSNMLSPDESALVQNIKSLLEQLGQLDAGAQAVSGQLPDPAMMSADPLMNQSTEGELPPMEEGMPMDDQDPTKVSPDAMGDEEDTVEKADQDGTAVVATDDPEDKAEDANTSITEENLKVLKSLVERLEKMSTKKATTTVAKSAGAQSPMGDSAIVALSAGVAELAKVVKSLNTRQSAIETAVVNILRGAGIPEMVQKSQIQKPMLTTPLDPGHPSNVNSVVQKAQGAQGGEDQQPVLKGRDAVRKSLGELLPAMVQGKY